MVQLLINILIIVFLYVVPLIVFIKYSTEINLGITLLIVIGLVYGLLVLFTSKFTYNLMPFVLVIACLVYFRKIHNQQKQLKLQNGEIEGDSPNYSDYAIYGFTLKEFSILRAIKFTVLIYIASICVESLFFMLFNYLKLNLSQQEVVQYMTNLPINQFIIFIPVSVIFAPVVEEFVFRYILFEKILNKRIPSILSSIISSLIFALIHFNLRAFPILVSIGLANCYLIHKKGFWYSVFNHSMFNLVTIMALLIDKVP
ncbi:MAG: CPBP family intramembrane metalloprotease [Bacillota bacterium]|nr:CPBP family intramembrane metalloprotease [Bacillota bacterium]